jgi:dihydroneopterin aldolase
MATARIMLSGIRASGRHGANPGEQLEAQEYVVDLDLSIEVHGDDLDATTDYGAIADEARGAIENKPGAASSLGIDDVSCEAVIA